MNANGAYWIAFALMSASCAGFDVPWGSIVTPSTLNENVEKYNQRNLFVEGYVELDPDGHVLYESKRLKDEFDKKWDSQSQNFDPRKYFKYCLTIINFDFLYPYRRDISGKTFVFKAKFVDKYLRDDQIDHGSCPLSSGVVIDERDFMNRYSYIFERRKNGEPSLE